MEAVDSRAGTRTREMRREAGPESWCPGAARPKLCPQAREPPLPPWKPLPPRSLGLQGLPEAKAHPHCLRLAQHSHTTFAFYYLKTL